MESDSLMAVLGTVGYAIQVIMFAVTLFFGFCLYKIASKLGVKHSWMGFFPFLQTYTFVKC